MNRVLLLTLPILGWQHLPIAMRLPAAGEQSRHVCNCGCGDQCRCCCKPSRENPLKSPPGHTLCACPIPTAVVSPTPTVKISQCLCGIAQACSLESDLQSQGREFRLACARCHGPPAHFPPIQTFELLI